MSALPILPVASGSTRTSTASVVTVATKPATSGNAPKITPQAVTIASAAAGTTPTPTNWWMHSTFGLSAVLLVLGITSYRQSRKLEQLLQQEKLRAKQLKYHVKKRGETIVKMEKNPDLVNSRDFNLDYLRMRMAEDAFHSTIVNQIKSKVRDKISIALRPKQVSNGELGIASKSGRQVDEIFDVSYKTETDLTPRVLFRVGIQMVKLPTQPTSVTIQQLIDCIETFLSPSQEHDTWQPTIQGRMAHVRWDQKAKPTPLLLIEQNQEGANVTFRTQRSMAPPA